MYSTFAMPLLVDGHVYCVCRDGELRCVKVETGKRVWESPQPLGGKKTRWGNVFLVKNGEHYFLTTEAGDLIIAKLSPTGYEEISRTRLLAPTTNTGNGRTVVWSHLAFANRSVYARNDKEIVCVSLAGE